jgi:two-component system, sensor histidine kinase and response regulator
MKTVLIVDDDRQLREMFSRALERKGYRIIEADSGPAGLAMARKYLPDLILSDIHMPGGDGSTLLRDIRHDPELRGKQVVLMTGRPDLITPRGGMEDGADDFLVKPVEIKALLNCVEARFARALINWRVEDQMLAQLQTLVPPQLPHEFFTPLAGIIGLMDVLRSDFPSMASNEVVEIHDDIYQSAIRLHRTLRNYLLILELQNAPPPSPPGLLTPAEVEKGIRSGVTEALRQNDRQDDVTIQIDACSIPVKREDLSRIVEELVDNACKFSRRGTPIKVDLAPGGQLTITDKGRGLTAEEIGRIGVFQQFDRGKHEQQGLGLGLVLVQKLATQYGASFRIDSHPGEGTSVHITFTSS